MSRCVIVDLTEIQAAYYMVAATGVLVAAIYYVLNMRATLQTRRIGLIDSIVTWIVNKEGFQNYFELLRYEWRDYEDFEKKYGFENDVETAAKRYAVFNSFNMIGGMLRKGIVSADDLYEAGLTSTIFIWRKYKPVIEESRRRYFGGGMFVDFEFLAGEMLRVVRERDPGFSFPETLDRYVPDS